jgi:hypothetical protein
MLKRWANMIITIGLAMVLTACGGSFPSHRVIEQAIALQVQQVQADLSQQLKLKAPTLKDIRIQHLQIEDSTGINLDREPGYHISGQYDLSLRQSDHQAMQTGDRFDLYLQKHTEGSGKTQKQVWRLAEPEGAGWKMQAIAIK